MTSNEKILADVFREVRTCFNQLKTLAEQLHADLHVNPSMRAVMESLASGGPRTVPEIARSKRVSRQHIQTIVNSLQAAGLVGAGDNPAHRRSPHFLLTAEGRALFATIEAREREPLRRISRSLPDGTLRHAAQVLRDLNRQIAQEIATGDCHE